MRWTLALLISEGDYLRSALPKTQNEAVWMFGIEEFNGAKLCLKSTKLPRFAFLKQLCATCKIFPKDCRISRRNFMIGLTEPRNWTIILGARVHKLHRFSLNWKESYSFSCWGGFLWHNAFLASHFSRMKEGFRRFRIYWFHTTVILCSCAGCFNRWPLSLFSCCFGSFSKLIVLTD